MLGQIDTEIFYDNLKNVLGRELDGDSTLVDAIEELGILSDEITVVKRDNPLDTLSGFLEKRLSFGTNIYSIY